VVKGKEREKKEKRIPPFRTTCGWGYK